MPTYPDFNEPVRLMSESVGPASEEQRQLATKVGLTLDDDVPRSVAAALLEDYLQPAIRGTYPSKITDRQREFLRELGSVRGETSDVTRGVASAWIDHVLTLRNIDLLIRLRPVRNESVIVASDVQLDGRRGQFLE